MLRGREGWWPDCSMRGSEDHLRIRSRTVISEVFTSRHNVDCPLLQVLFCGVAESWLGNAMDAKQSVVSKCFSEEFKAWS